MVVGSDHASLPARRLAERLRDLREQEFRPLTQRVLGKALGGSDPLSIATVSLWENPSSERLPPPQRLKAYARLFCSSRSFASATPHLLRDDELTDVERERELELYEELLGLRERAQSTDITPLAPEPRNSIWQFPATQGLTIVCSRAPDPPPYAERTHLNFTPAASFADLNSLIVVHGQLRADNPASKIQTVLPEELDQDTAFNDLVLIGGAAVAKAAKIDVAIVDDVIPDTNTASQAVNRLVPDIPLPVAEEIPGTGTGTHRFKCSVGDQQRVFESLHDNGVLVEDVGLFARGPHPHIPGQTVTLLSGITSRGVYGAALCCIDEKLRKVNENYLRDALRTVDEFCILMRVPVQNHTALPPNLSNSKNCLWQWSAETGAHWGQP